MVKLSGFLSQSLQEFQSYISKGTIPVVVYFFTNSCSVCKAVTPRLREYPGRFPDTEIIHLNAEVAADIAQFYRILAVPTFIIFREGKERLRIIGGDLRRLEEGIKDQLGMQRVPSAVDMTYL